MADEAKVEAVDINTLDLDAGVQVDINPEADPFAFPPPPPDGQYRAKLKQKATKSGSLWERRQDKQGGYYFATQIEARLIDEGQRWDDSPVFDNFVSTMVMQNGSSRVIGVLKALGKSVPSRSTHEQLAKALTDALAAEPQARVTLQWRASAEVGTDDSGKKVYKEVKGMKKFKQLADGSHDPVITIEGVDASAQASIVDYKAI